MRKLKLQTLYIHRTILPISKKNHEARIVKHTRKNNFISPQKGCKILYHIQLVLYHIVYHMEY